MSSISALLNPRSIAVVGASPRGGRGGRTLDNLRATAFTGDVFAINPRYEEVLGFPCYPTLDSTPAPVDCAIMAIRAEAALETLEQAFERGLRAAVVLAAGFGEGGQHQDRAERLRLLGDGGMCICGPNCYGLLSISEGRVITAFSGRLPTPLLSGNVALISQSGGLSSSAFVPLMTDRQLGFRYVISCGNQIATTIEDYMEAFVDDPDVTLIASVVESIKNPQKFQRVARLAHARGKRMIFYHVGRSAVGRQLTQSHTGALVGDAEILAAFLRRCGVVCADNFDEFVETIELFAAVPPDCDVSREVVVISGSGGSAAIAADTLDSVGMGLPLFAPSTQQRLQSILPDFGNVTNPLDGTGTMSEDPTVLENILDAVLAEKSRAIVATTVTAKQVASTKEHRFSELVAQGARTSGRAMVAVQYSPLGGPLNSKIMERLHSAHVPLLLGAETGMRVLRHLPTARDYRRDVLDRDWSQGELRKPTLSTAPDTAERWDFMTTRQALIDNGVAVIAADLARSEREAVTIFRKSGCPVALKAEVEGLVHKSDIGCVRLNCASEEDVIGAYRNIVENARKAGFHALDGVLIQPMVSGVAEAYAGVMSDPIFGPAICFGLGGVFVEIFKDTATEIAPLSQKDARGMIKRLKAAPILFGARGRPPGDIDALVEFLVRLSLFALANAGRFRTLDLNPVIVKPQGGGVVAVDIAVETADAARATAAAKSGQANPVSFASVESRQDKLVN